MPQYTAAVQEVTQKQGQRGAYWRVKLDNNVGYINMFTPPPAIGEICYWTLEQNGQYLNYKSHQPVAQSQQPVYQPSGQYAAPAPQPQYQAPAPQVYQAPAAAPAPAPAATAVADWEFPNKAAGGNGNGGGEYSRPMDPATARRVTRLSLFAAVLGLVKDGEGTVEQKALKAATVVEDLLLDWAMTGEPPKVRLKCPAMPQDASDGDGKPSASVFRSQMACEFGVEAEAITEAMERLWPNGENMPHWKDREQVWARVWAQLQVMKRG